MIGARVAALPQGAAKQPGRSQNGAGDAWAAIVAARL
jgi:hypothetical protein